MIKEELFKFFKSKKSLLLFAFLLAIAISASVLAICVSNYSLKMSHEVGNTKMHFHPAFASLIAAGGGSSYLLNMSSLFCWLMPIYVVFGYCSKSIQEKKNNMNNIYLTKVTRKKYFFSKIATAFIIGVFLMMVPNLVNLLINVIFLNGGQFFSGMEKWNAPGQEYLYNCIKHPYTAYFLYLLSGSFAAGILSVVCQSLSFLFNDLKWVYLVGVSFWLLMYSTGNYTLDKLQQPFCLENMLEPSIITLIILLAIAAVVFFGALIKSSVKKDEI